MIRFQCLLLVAIIFYSCDKRTASNKFSDPLIQRIYDLKDRRMSDSLFQYLKHEDPAIRREAALAFGSIQDSASSKRLGALLDDKDRSVRRAAAFALGQTPCTDSRRILEANLEKENDPEIFVEIAEAYGKVTKHWKNFDPRYYSDSTRDYGVAWSLYRAGLNGTVDTTEYRRVVALLKNDHRELTRLGGSHFFARSSRDFTPVLHSVINAAKNDNSAEVRMAAVLALRRVKNDTSLLAISGVLKNDNDYRVRVNAARALQPFSFEQTKQMLFNALRDKNMNVGIAASEVIVGKAENKYWVELANVAASTTNWRAQANLYQAAFAANGSSQIEDEIKTIYQVTKDPYHKAALLSALQSSTKSWSFINDEFQKADVPIVKTTALSALVAMNKKKEFDPSLKKNFMEVYVRAIESGDAALIATASDALADSTLGYQSIVKDVSFLKSAKGKLDLPKDVDAVAPLEAAIAHLEKRKNTYRSKPEWNHPIDWQLVRMIQKDQTAVIHTSKGNITIRFAVEEAPGSVANFISLVQQDYFDHKFFHRVVPNFVIQGGCYRGDGTGSEDYSIRSEFAQRKYKTGSVGMASSGKDTEGTQWFITHSPTPHLDGRYTIFAEVEKGIEVVHQIEVGDEIIDITLPGLEKENKK
jgi:cyclophilin family peptidyl-prolyl cis-trans isomerase/HEAT repeat protein